MFASLSVDEKTAAIKARDANNVTININEIKERLREFGYDTINEIYFVMVHKTAIECVQTYLDAEKVIKNIQTDIENAMKDGEEEPMLASVDDDSVRSIPPLSDLESNDGSDEEEHDNGNP